MSLVEFREVTRSFMPRHGVGGLLTRKRTALVAVDRLSLAIEAGETLGLVGESGSGKTVSGEMLVRLQRPDSGVIAYDGQDIARLRAAGLRSFRRDVQMIFQDPFGSLNPRFTVRRTLLEPLRIHRLPVDPERAVHEVLELVELRPVERYLDRYPHELSGGERQRVAIARALILKPRLLVADEPTSMLDASVRAGILNLFRRLKQQLNVTMLFISHDLATVGYLCDRVAVMYLGKLVEVGTTAEILQRPRHPYTQMLMAAVPRLHAPPPGPAVDEPEPGGADPPAQRSTCGCHFRNRCSQRLPLCNSQEPELVLAEDLHRVACHAVALDSV